MCEAFIPTSRFELREIQRSDIVHIYRGLSDDRVTRYYAVHFPSLEATQEQMDWYENLKNSGAGFWWGIYGKETGVFYGAGGYNDLDKVNRKAEIGFWLLPEFWGNGILKEVMPVLFRAGFHQLKLNRIEGFVDARNKACKRALQKINFQKEGSLKEAEIKEGQFIDIEIYAILKKNFKE